MQELDKSSFGGERRGTFRGSLPKAKKIKQVANAAAEKADINIPKTLLGFLIACVCGYLYIQLKIPFADYGFGLGLSMMTAGIGLKYNRAKKGGDPMRGEKALLEFLKKLIKKGK